MLSLNNQRTLLIKLNLSKNSCPLILGLAWLITTLVIRWFLFHSLISFYLKNGCISELGKKKQVNTKAALISTGHTRLPTASATDKMTRIGLISSPGWSWKVRSLNSPGVTETGAGTISGIPTFTTASGAAATGKRTSQTKRGDLTVVRRERIN